MNEIQDLNEEINFFNRFNNEYNTITADTFNIIYEELNKLNIQGLILEAGCGTATFGKKLIEKNEKISIIGVDINERFINQINKFKITRYKALHGNLNNKDLFQTKTFDAIIFPYVLHHFRDINKVIKNSHYWLKENGIIVIIDPNGSNPVLKFSYKCRFYLQKIFPKRLSKYGSKNEKHIPADVFLYNLKGLFKISVFKSFLIKTKIVNIFNIIMFMLYSRLILLKIYNVLPVSKFPGSDIIIIGEKIEK